MKPIAVSETVHAPIGDVFAAASDIPNAATRVRGINRIEMLTEGPVGQGTKWRETRTMFGRQASETMWIAEWEPPRRYVVEARSHGAHYLTPITFEDLGDGSTRMTMTMHATPETFMARVMMKLFAGMRSKIVSCLADDLKDIRAYCESPSRAPTAG